MLFKSGDHLSFFFSNSLVFLFFSESESFSAVGVGIFFSNRAEMQSFSWCRATFSEFLRKFSRTIWQMLRKCWVRSGAEMRKSCRVLRLSIYFWKLLSIQPRTSTAKFARSPWTRLLGLLQLPQVFSTLCEYDCRGSHTWFGSFHHCNHVYDIDRIIYCINLHISIGAQGCTKYGHMQLDSGTISMSFNFHF